MGYGTDGWKLRYNTKADRTLLRPDLANCLRSPEPECHSVSKRFNAEVFAKGNKRIYLYIRHFGADIFDHIPNDELRILGKRYRPSRWALLSTSSFASEEYLSTEWIDLEPWNGFELRKMKNHGGKGAYFLKATLEDDSKVVLDILTNAPLEDVKSQLASMDLDMLRLLTSPIPYDGFDTLEEYVTADLAERVKRARFGVLSEDALAAKVAAMASEQRIRYARDIINHAMIKNNALSDYDISYHPTGEQGLRDTREFLAGHVSDDDPRYAVLKEEHDRSYPIGSCLLTGLGMACRDEAEMFRIAAYLRDQVVANNSGKASGDGESSYFEQAFRQDMLEIERQMTEALERLAQLRGGD